MCIDAKAHLPQKNAMQFVDYIRLSEQSSVAKAMIRNDNPLMTVNGLPAHAGIEYMAQAIAGTRNYEGSAGDKAGVILDVKEIEIQQSFFTPDEEINVFVDVVHKDGKYEVSACKVEQGKLIISAEISVMETDNG
jgi:predicted hotdog family 3-hydroxylacyl-ACP dehydratase